MALSPEDPHSYARPDLVAVIHTHLNLYVNFERNVLSGSAILSVCKIHKCEEIVLDTFGLNIFDVKDVATGAALEYNIGQSGIFGSKFTIKIPDTNPESLSQRRIKIGYETRPNSPALYWLTPEQTSDGIHPLLISNSKLTFARAIFPCQDTPSVEFTFFAKITVPPNFIVMMPGRVAVHFNANNKIVYRYRQKKRIPSYAMVLVVGSLEHKILNDTFRGIKCHLWAEEKYIERSTNALVKIMHMLETVKKLEDCLYDFNVCVLPPTVPEFDLQIPGVTFLSPTLLDGNLCSFTSSVLQNVLESWIGNVVPFGNFEHLWLLKSISIFFYRKIISDINEGEKTKKFLEAKGITDLKNMLNVHGDVGLVPDLKGILPKNIIKYVPYEKGYWLLDHLQHSLGGFEYILAFLKYYIERNKTLNRAKECWNTDGFKKAFDINFCERIGSQPEVDWNEWFHKLEDLSFYHLNSRIPIFPEIECHIDARQWLAEQTQKELFAMTTKLAGRFDLEKMEFLAYLHASPTVLPIDKLRILQYAFLNYQQICDIRFLWLRLCIKSKWLKMVRHALEFACEYCTPKYASPIFRDLYEWTASRNLAISWFKVECGRMIPETRIELESILNLDIDEILEDIE